MGLSPLAPRHIEIFRLARLSRRLKSALRPAKSHPWPPGNRPGMMRIATPDLSREGAKTPLNSFLPQAAMRQVFLCIFAPWRDVVLLLTLFCGVTCAWAGGGPENVFLVVNPRSPASLTIANHYARLRQIPPDHLLYLPWDPKLPTTDVDTFRRQILTPLLQAIQERRLANQIDCIVYSSDFPWGIRLESDIRKFTEAMQRQEPPSGKTDDKSDQAPPAAKREWPKQLTPLGSITGLTYLWQPVIAGHAAYFDLRTNHYMAPPGSEPRVPPSAGFRGNRQYNPKGEVVASGGRRYFLSMMLGVTAGRGNTLAEVLAYLERSAAADGTHPKGTIYFVQNGDIRSKVRQATLSRRCRGAEEAGRGRRDPRGHGPLAGKTTCRAR